MCIQRMRCEVSSISENMAQKKTCVTVKDKAKIVGLTETSDNRTQLVWDLIGRRGIRILRDVLFYKHVIQAPQLVSFFEHPCHRKDGVMFHVKR